MATTTTRFALSKPASGDNVSSFQSTIGTTLDTVDLNMIGLQGAYAGGTTYHQGDVVTSGGAYYVSTTTQSGAAPPGATWLQIMPSVGHYAETTVSVSSASTGAVIASGLTVVHDTDSYVSGGTFTVPAGLGGLYMFNAFIQFPAANYHSSYMVVQLQRGGAQIAEHREHIAGAETASIQYDLPCSWVGVAAAADAFTVFAEQDSGSAQTITGRITLARLGNT